MRTMFNFNWPTKEELKEIGKYQEQTGRHIPGASDRSGIYPDDRPPIRDCRIRKDTVRNSWRSPKYFSALLIFCQAQGIPFPPYLRRLIGTEGRLPELTDKWLEALLQGFLYDDTDSYLVSEEARERIQKQLKEAGCIYRKKVSLTHKDALQKLLVKSQGKMESIGRIVETEQQAMGERLRLLILCDYIKKEKLSVVGTEEDYDLRRSGRCLSLSSCGAKIRPGSGLEYSVVPWSSCPWTRRRSWRS